MMKTEPCGKCGLQSYQCDSDCKWQAQGGCMGEGSCTPGQVSEVACSACGVMVRTCTATCQWTAWGPCQTKGCNPGETKVVACGKKGIGMATCDASCKFPPPTVCVECDSSVFGVSFCCGYKQCATCQAQGWSSCMFCPACTGN